MKTPIERKKPVGIIGTSVHPMHESAAEQALWRAVTCQAIRDLAAGTPDEQLEVAEWLGTSDYQSVCDMGGIDPDWLMGRVGECIKHPPPYRRYHLSKLAKAIASGLSEMEEPIEEQAPEGGAP